MRRSVLLCLFASLGLAAEVSGQDAYEHPLDIPAVRSFVGSEGFGRAHDDAAPEVREFGQLVGAWHVNEVEVLSQDGQWGTSAPGVWVWKYAIGGFAVEDLFYQAGDRLPAYLGPLGRAYMLSAIRVYDVRAGLWRVSWMANGAGKAPGMDYGIFEARAEGTELVMTEPFLEGPSRQRVVFSEFSSDSFRWRSEYSSDGGATWITVMRMKASRVSG